VSTLVKKILEWEETFTDDLNFLVTLGVNFAYMSKLLRRQYKNLKGLKKVLKDITAGDDHSELRQALSGSFETLAVMLVSDYTSLLMTG
jgi:hypothetical protein